MLFRNFFLISLWGSLILGAQDLSLVDPAFNAPNLHNLERLTQSHPESQLQIQFFKAETLYWQGKIHAAQESLDLMLERCRASSQLSERHQMVCALACVGFESKPVSPTNLLWREPKLREWLKVLDTSKSSFEEKAYFEGRILWKIPSEFGGSVGKSLIALELLRRSRPQLSSVPFFIAEIYQFQGKDNLAQQQRELALKFSPPDVRTQWFLNQREERTHRYYWSLLGSPAGGWGVLLGKRDERWLDTDRRLNISVFGQSRGVFGIRGALHDFESWKEHRVSFLGSFARNRDQYFGLGADSRLDQLTEILQNQSEGAVTFRRFWKDFYFQWGMGWFWRSPVAVSGVLSTEARLGLVEWNGIPEVEIGFETRKGLKLFGNFSMARKGSLGTHNFEKVQAGISQRWALSGTTQFSLASQVRSISRSGPFGLLSTIQGNLTLPGVRFGRFRDPVIWTASSELKKSIGNAGSIAGFGSLASIQGRWLSGGGLAFILGTGAVGSRIEWGYFAGESLIQAGLSLAFE